MRLSATESGEYLAGLARMANQIADNVGRHGADASAVAEHIERFWDPSMRRDLAQAVANGAVVVVPAVRTALQNLARPR